jgi:hypothetical protein
MQHMKTRSNRLENYAIRQILESLSKQFDDAGIQKWRAVKQALLTQKHAAERLAWAKQYRHWTRDNWAKVIFFDESLIKKDSDGPIRWVFQHQNKREKYAPKNVAGKKKGSGLSQMT